MDEQLRILKMVEEGTITAEQGAELMAAMNIELPARQTAVEKSSYDKKLLRIIVDSVTGDKVNIQFPVGAVRKILKATGKLPIPEQNLQGWILRLSWRRFPNAWMKRLKETLLMWRQRTERP